MQIWIKTNFLLLDCRQRVEFVNDLLKNKGFDLQQVAEHIGINYSTFTKLMTEGDFVYIKWDGQYFRFIRDGDTISSIDNSADDFTVFLHENIDILKAIIEKYKSNDDFTVDKSIFKSSSKQSVKTFRIPDDLYQKFVDTCETEFPHLKLQNIIAQLLMDFTNKYNHND